jgi:peptidoglycan/xylan/chitin deacetylase (PgdA/CDA1 family)
MCRIFRYILLSIILIAFNTPKSVGAGYLNTIRSAITNIARGAYNEAAADIWQVSILDDKDALGHKLMGVLYLHTGKLPDAELEFRKSLKANPYDWQCQYSIGLIHLVRKEIHQARALFESVSKLPNVPPDASLILTYLDVLSGKPSTAISELEGLTPFAHQLVAFTDQSIGKKEEAITRLEELVRKPPNPGFEEHHAPLATFDPLQPIELPKGKLTWKPTSRKNVPVVSGRLTLRADTSRSSDVLFVALYVDGTLAGITNCAPYQFVWNTTKYTNGLHEIRMEGKNAFGDLVSQKSFWVIVNNPDGTRDGLDGNSEAVRDINNRIWDCIRLTESHKVMHYQLAKLYIEMGDTSNALAHLRYVVAYEPGYRDARKLLVQLIGCPAKYLEIKRGKSGVKKVAITFDDGPNERTTELLDILARYKVTATFFIVGFRAEAQPELIRAIQSAGHEIANHTYSHPDLSKLSADEVEAELSKTEAIIYALTGKSTMYFRPPGGHISQATKIAAARQGFKAVLWTVGCSRYEGTTAEALVSHVVNNITDGAIILMHNGEPVTSASLPKIIGQLRAQGYEFVTLSELLDGQM